MKTPTALLVLLLLHIPAQAQRSVMRWTPGNVAWGAAATGAIVADCVTTRAWLASSPDHTERNPVLGGRPSAGYLNVVCGVSIAGTWFLAHQLQSKHRRWLFLAVAVVETGAAVWNISGHH